MAKFNNFITHETITNMVLLLVESNVYYCCYNDHNNVCIIIIFYQSKDLKVSISIFGPHLE